MTFKKIVNNKKIKTVYQEISQQVSELVAVRGKEEKFRENVSFTKNAENVSRMNQRVVSIQIA